MHHPVPVLRMDSLDTLADVRPSQGQNRKSNAITYFYLAFLYFPIFSAFIGSLSALCGFSSERSPQLVTLAYNSSLASLVELQLHTKDPNEEQERPCVQQDCTEIDLPLLRVLEGQRAKMHHERSSCVCRQYARNWLADCVYGLEGGTSNWGSAVTADWETPTEFLQKGDTVPCKTASR